MNENNDGSEVEETYILKNWQQMIEESDFFKNNSCKFQFTLFVGQIIKDQIEKDAKIIGNKYLTDGCNCLECLRIKEAQQKILTQK